MAQPKSVVGLDVHATQTHACVLCPETGELRSKRLNGPPRRALDFLEGLHAPVLAVYEAGPTGYGLARGAVERDLDVRICAPGSIPKAPSDRVKTDRRDAERLARLCLAGELSFVRVPSPEEERFRDLARCREAIRADLMRARHRVGKFLLRRELRWGGPGSAWTQAHWRWLAGIEFSDGASSAVLADYLSAVRALEQRRGVAERAIEEGWPESPWAETIARLRCLRGIDTLTALGLCGEAGDLRRFERPASLMAYFGIVPSEHSSGGSGGAARSPRRAPRMPAGCWSRPPTTTATRPGWRGRWSVASAASTHERVRSAGALRSACIVAGNGCGWSGASPPTWSGSPWHASSAALCGRWGSWTERAGKPTRPRRRCRGGTRSTKASTSPQGGLRCVLGQPAGIPAGRARFKTAGHATNRRSWGSQSPHMRLTMQSTRLEFARVAPRAPRHRGRGPSGTRSILPA